MVKWTGLVPHNVKRFRGGLVFKSDSLVYHSTLGLRVIQKRKVEGRPLGEVVHDVLEGRFIEHRGDVFAWSGVQGSGFRVQGSGSGVQGLGFRVQGSGSGVQGSGFTLRG